jgi:hypothetical protein
MKKAERKENERDEMNGFGDQTRMSREKLKLKSTELNTVKQRKIIN